MGQDDLGPSKGLEEAFTRWLLGSSVRVAFVETGQCFIHLVQAATNLAFDQGQQPEGNGQEVSQADNLVVTTHEQRAETQGQVFDQVEVTFQRPIAAVMNGGLSADAISFNCDRSGR